MKTLLIILALATFSFAQKAVVTAEKVKLRSEPSAKGKVTGQLVKDESVRILIAKDGWLLVESSHVSGWLQEGNVQKLEPAPPPKIAPRVEDSQSRIIYGRCKDDSVVFVDNKKEACKDHNGIALWYADDLSGFYVPGQMAIGVGMNMSDFMRTCKYGIDTSDATTSFEDTYSAPTTRVDMYAASGRRSDCVGRFLFRNNQLVSMWHFK